MFTVNKNPSTKELHKFGVAMLIGFWIIGALLFFAPFLKTWDVLALEVTGTRTQLTAFGLQALGVGLCVLSFTWPAGAKPVYIVWMTAGIKIGTVMTTILLTALFVLLLPVFSIIVRFSDPLRKKLNRNSSTYWEDYKRHDATLERVGRPF
jgi:hypothetical protein